MKNEKMLTKLLTLLFVVSLTFNLFAQENGKKESKVVYKSKKDGKMLKWDVKKDKNLVWVMKGDDFEWDTTFTVDGDEDLDINLFLKERFPEIDSIKNKRIVVKMEGDNRHLKVMSGGLRDELLELKTNVFIDDDGEAITLHIDEMDSLLSKHKMLKNYVISGDLSSKFEVLHKNLDGLKYEILTSIDEDDDEHTVHLEVLKDIGVNMRNFEFIVHDGDKSKLKNVYELHSNELSFGLVVDDELEQSDLEFLKKSGVKLGKAKLALSKLFLYNDGDDFLNLKFKLKTEGKTTITIIDEAGKEVFVDKVQYFPGTYDKQTTLSLEDEGIYYISIEQNGKANAFKLTFD